MDTAEKRDAESQTTYDRKEYADPELESATINVLFSVGVFVLTAVVFIAIGVSAVRMPGGANAQNCPIAFSEK